jgi:hypothetical protein
MPNGLSAVGHACTSVGGWIVYDAELLQQAVVAFRELDDLAVHQVPHVYHAQAGSFAGGDRQRQPFTRVRAAKSVANDQT